MKTREELESIIFRGDMEKQLIAASLRNDTRFWLQFIAFKMELSEEKLVPYVNKEFLFRPEIFKFLLKKLDSAKKLMDLVFKEGTLNVELIELLINNFDNNCSPMDYFPKISSKDHYYTIISVCHKKNIPSKKMYGLIDVIDIAIIDEELVVNLLKYIAKNAINDLELSNMAMYISEKTLKNGFDASHILYNFGASEFSNGVLNDPDFVEGRKIFGR